MTFFSRLLAVLGLAALALPGCAQHHEDSAAWKAVRTLIEKDVGAVPTVSTDTLVAWLDGRDPLLLDGRTAEEYAVSHLTGARHVDPDATAEELSDALADVAEERPIVVYCSVGYRSAVLTQRLQEAGFEEVYNLEGSIFQWANEGRTVVRDGEPVRQVHPYDPTWARLLKPELRADG